MLAAAHCDDYNEWSRGKRTPVREPPRLSVYKRREPGVGHSSVSRVPCADFGQIVRTTADAGFAGVGLHSFFEEIESIEVVMAPRQRSRTSIDDGRELSEPYVTPGRAP